MSDGNVTSIADFQRRYEDYAQRPLVKSGGGDDPPGMDARVTILEHLAAQTKTELQDIRSDIKAERAENRTRYLTLIVTTITTGLAVAAIMLTMQSNMLSAFQAGLSAVQAATGGSQPAPQPIVIQLPPAPLPSAQAPRSPP